MKDFNLKEIIGLIRRTAPFLIFRFAIYMGVTAAFVLATGTGAGLGYGIGKIAGNEAAGSGWGGLIGFGIAGAALVFFREYLLYLVKAGHIAVLVELMDGKDIPQGRSQIEHGRKVVRERFVESSVLFGLDQLIKGILRAFNRTFFTIASFLPLPGVKGLVKFANTVLTLSLTYLDEVILAYNIRTRSENPWQSSRTALILYAQNYKTFLRNAVWLALMIWGLVFLVFLAVLGPLVLLVGLIPALAGPLTLVLALIFAWGVKEALIEPVAMTALMQVFFKATEGQEPNPEWEEKLDRVSGKFNELKRKASDWATGRPAPDSAVSHPTPPN